MIRDATPDDAHAVADIWNHYIRNTLVTFNFAEKSVVDVAADLTARQAQGHGFSWRKGMWGLLALPPMGNFGVAWAMRIQWNILCNYTRIILAVGSDGPL